MKTVAMGIVCTMCPMICVLSAAWLAHNERDGWGWFLLLSALTGLSYKSGDDKENKSQDEKEKP